MKVTVDSSRCAGHAQCSALGPDVYQLDDSGYCAIGEAEVPAGLEGQARDGAGACPEGAISIISLPPPAAAGAREGSVRTT